MDPQMQELARTLASLTDEEYAAVTEEARGPEIPKGNHVPGIGGHPTSRYPHPTTMWGKIFAAEAAGDRNLVMLLKAQWPSANRPRALELRRKNHVATLV